MTADGPTLQRSGARTSWGSSKPAFVARMLLGLLLISGGINNFLARNPVPNPSPEGDRVLAMRWSANLDPKQFADPETFDLERSPNRHQTFGLGPHRCAGSHLARIMFQEMVTRLLERIPDYEIDESRVVHYPDQGAFSGLTLLPATFTAGQRVGNGR